MIRIKSLLAFFGILAISSTAVFSAEPVIVTVNVARITEAYYKVQDFYAELQGSEEQVKGKVEEMQKQGEALVLDYQELAEQAQSDILTEEARKEAQDAAMEIGQQIQEKEGQMRQFLQQVQQTIQTREQNQMSIFIKEIKDIIDVVTEEKGATLVLDVSGASRSGLPIVISSDPSYDVSDLVIERLNADKPVEEEVEAAVSEAE